MPLSVMISELKPLGAFVENTVRPMLKEFGWLLNEFKLAGIPITEDNIIRFIKKSGDLFLTQLLIQLVQNVSIAVIICYTVYRIHS